MSLAALVACPVVAARCSVRIRLVALAAVGCAVADVVTPFTGSPLPSQLTRALRFLLPAIARLVVAAVATLGVLGVIRVRRALGGMARRIPFRGAAACAALVLAILATAHL